MESRAEKVKTLNCKGKEISVVGDVSKQEDVDRLFEKVKNENEKLDVLISNAGVMDNFKPITYCEEETFDRLLFFII